MRALAILVILFACGGSEKAAPPPSGSGPKRMQRVYDIDLDKAIDDRYSSIRRDLESAFVDKKLPAKVHFTMEGLVITSEDPARKGELEELLKGDYADSIEVRACGADLCVRIGAATAAAIKKAALNQAITTIRHRLDELKLREPSVTPRGEQIVVEVDASEDRAKMLVARTGKLEFKVVDSGAPLMKGVYALAAEDPRARELGVQGQLDQWRVEDSAEVGIDYYFLAPERASLEKYFGELGMRDPRYKLPDDRQLGYERLETRDKKVVWRSYYLERPAVMTGADVAKAEGSWDPNTSRPTVLLDFTRAGADKFGDVTARIVGKKLATILDDEIKSAPIINGPIRGGRASIMMGGSDARQQQQDSDELVNVLKTGSLPAPLREVSATPVPQ